MAFREVRGENHPGGPPHSANEGRVLWNENDSELFGLVGQKANSSHSHDAAPTEATANRAVDPAERVVLIKANSGPVALVLPLSADAEERGYVFVNASSGSNLASVSPAEGEEINGSLPAVSSTHPGDAVELVPVSGGWRIASPMSGASGLESEPAAATSGVSYAEKGFYRQTPALGAIPERWVAPFDLEITGVRVSAYSAPSSGSVVADINLATPSSPGTWQSLYTEQADRPTLSAGQHHAEAALPDGVFVSAGEFLSVDLDSVGTGASGVLISVSYSFQPAQAALDPYFEEVMADGPAAYWRLGELSGTLAADETEGALHGSYLGGPSLGEAGAIGANSAVLFQKSLSQHVLIPDDDGTLSFGDAFSVELWFKRPAGSGGTLEALAGKGTGSWSLRIGTDDKVHFRKFGVADICTTTGTVTDSEWHHLVATKNGATSKLYLDGADVTGTVTDQTVGDNTIAVTLARNGGNSTDYGDVYLDEAALYPYALSAARVAAHFSAAALS